MDRTRLPPPPRVTVVMLIVMGLLTFVTTVVKSWLSSLHDLLPGSENTYGQKTNHNINSWSEMTTYRGIRYNKIIEAPTGKTLIEASGFTLKTLTASFEPATVSSFVHNGDTS